MVQQHLKQSKNDSCKIKIKEDDDDEDKENKITRASGSDNLAVYLQLNEKRRMLHEDQNNTSVGDSLGDMDENGLFEITAATDNEKPSLSSSAPKPSSINVPQRQHKKNNKFSNDAHQETGKIFTNILSCKFETKIKLDLIFTRIPNGTQSTNKYGSYKIEISTVNE
ncbi:unnamed protein product [Rotaria sp. Silwood1]|nr:unnamed protein product [Rotaria sp. Silwood1]CAF3896108.1 unnamed protein product [Rotaria sp. Silwood1]CAF5022139.1 unnamed protein product [Rotaria sp. Silwood1]CAF5077792.1 unnamed protein product [Rotaria sp. Silwood1]